MKNKVVLFSAIDADGFKQLPLPVLSIGTVLEKEHFIPVIIDVQLENNWEKRLQDELRDAVFFGVSCMTGSSIKNALRAIDLSKKYYPNLSIVFGGYHASCAYASLLLECDVDFVIIGPGENAIVKIANLLVNNESKNICKNDLENIPNLAYLWNGNVIKNEFQMIEDMDSFVPPMNYGLVNVFDYYYTNIVSKTQRRFYYCSSYGCPGNCTFCSEQKHTHLQWKGLSAHRIVSDLKNISLKYKPDRVQFVDPCFTTDTDRVVEFVQLMKKEDWKVNIMFDARISDLKRLSEKLDFMELHKVGVEKIYTGIETGSNRLLKALNKTFTCNDAYEMCYLLNKAGIITHLSFVHDFPDETNEDSKRTFELCGKLAELNNIRQLHRFFVPFEGTILYEELVNKNLIEKSSQNSWADTCIDGASSVWKGRKAFREEVVRNIENLSKQYPEVFKYQHSLIINE